MSHGWEKGDLLSSVFSAPIGKERGSNSWGLFICICHCPESLAPQLIIAGYSDTAWPLTALSENIQMTQKVATYTQEVSHLFSGWVMEVDISCFNLVSKPARRFNKQAWPSKMITYSSIVIPESYSIKWKGEEDV